MNGLLDTSISSLLIKRLENLSENSQPLWGKMNIGDMLAHQIDILEVVLKIKPSAYPENISARFLANPIGRWFVIYAPFPWPKGKVQAPESFLQKKSVSFSEDLNRVKDLIHQFLDLGEKGEFGNSPILGKLSSKQWADLLYRHLDHHCKQFGV